MYIPLIARFTDSIIVSSSSLITSANRFWKWGPLLLLASIYAYTRFSRAVLRLHWRSADSSFSSSPILTADGEFFTSDDEDGDEVSSSSEDEDEGETERDCSASTSYDNLAGFYDGISEIKRKFKIRRNRSMSGVNVFSLGDLVNGKSVVKFWDGIGLDLKIGGFPASSAVAFAASGGGGEGKDGVKLWDVRVRRRTAAVKAEWSEREGGVAGNGRVWDLRNAKTPLENVTGFDGERWWDPNAVSQME